MMNRRDAFGLSSQRVVEDFNIDPENFDTFVFRKPKKFVVLTSRFFIVPESCKFFSVMEESEVEEPVQEDVQEQTPQEKYGTLNIGQVRQQSDNARDTSRILDDLTNKHIFVKKQVRSRFTANLEQKIESLKAFFVEELSPMNFAFDSAMVEATGMLRTLTNSDIDVKSTTVEAMFALAIDLKAMEFLAQQVGISEKYRDMIVERILDTRLAKPMLKSKDRALTS